MLVDLAGSERAGLAAAGSASQKQVIYWVIFGAWSLELGAGCGLAHSCWRACLQSVVTNSCPNSTSPRARASTWACCYRIIFKYLAEFSAPPPNCLPVRLFQGSGINVGLLYLGMVIKELAEKGSTLAYRNSMLTEVLRPGALGS